MRTAFKNFNVYSRLRYENFQYMYTENRIQAYGKVFGTASDCRKRSDSLRILIVEDEIEIADGIRTVLEKEGYQTDTVYDGLSGLDEMLSNIYDLVLLDIMLPKISGLDVLRSARNSGIDTPVILLTARSQTEDKIIGLDSGADDYLTKPFDAGELLARIRARFRRHESALTGVISFADIRLEQSSMKLYGREKSIKLAKKEYQLLEYLLINHGCILTRNMLVAKIWGYDDQAEYNQLDVYISFVRKKLKFVSADISIVTEKGVGYSLQAGRN